MWGRRVRAALPHLTARPTLSGPSRLSLWPAPLPRALAARRCSALPCLGCTGPDRAVPYRAALTPLTARPSLPPTPHPRSACQLDFVFANLLMALVADFMLVWLPAPTFSTR